MGHTAVKEDALKGRCVCVADKAESVPTGQVLLRFSGPIFSKEVGY